MTVLDTNILIYHLEGRLAQPIPSANIATSIISEIELLAHPMLDARGEAQIRGMLSNLPVIDLTQPIKDTAIRLRKDHNLTIADAIIAATAVSRGSILLTNDSKLAAIPELNCRRLILKAR